MGMMTFALACLAGPGFGRRLQAVEHISGDRLSRDEKSSDGEWARRPSGALGLSREIAGLLAHSTSVAAWQAVASGRSHGAHPRNQQRVPEALMAGELPQQLHFSEKDEDAEISDLMIKFDPLLHFARRFLPSDRARDASSLYAWCRRLDEIVDEPGAQPVQTLERLHDWQARLDDLSAGSPRDALDAALTRTFADRPTLGREPFEAMILGMREDIDPECSSVMRYEKFRPELLRYCYRVAGTVGEMLLPVLGLEGQETQEAAIALGCAIQLLNIIRDVRGDLDLRSRIYLPRADAKAVGMSDEELESAIREGTCTKRYRRLIRLQARRAAALLDRAEKSLEGMNTSSALLVAIIIELHRELVSEIKARDYDNLSGDRVRVSTSGKLGTALRVCFQLLLAPFTRSAKQMAISPT